MSITYDMLLTGNGIRPVRIATAVYTSATVQDTMEPHLSGRKTRSDIWCALTKPMSAYELSILLERAQTVINFQLRVMEIDGTATKETVTYRGRQTFLWRRNVIHGEEAA